MQLQLTDTELLDIYNHIPKILNANITPVLIVQENSSSSNTSIRFSGNANGNYWVLFTEDSIHWLFPKARRQINQYEYTTLESIFDCQGYQPEGSRSFLVHSPATVSKQSNGEVWMLEKKGRLEFGEVSPLAQLETVIEQTKEERERIIAELEQSKAEIERLTTELKYLSDDKQKLTQNLNNAEQERQKFLSLSLQQQEEFARQSKERQSLLSLLQEEKTKNKQLQSKIDQLTQASLNIVNKFSEFSQELHQQVHSTLNNLQRDDLKQSTTPVNLGSEKLHEPLKLVDPVNVTPPLHHWLWVNRLTLR